MITEMTTEELVVLGARHRADYLIEQAGYTLGLAAADGEALEALLPEGYIAEVNGALNAVNLARQDKALMAVESKDATSAHVQGYRNAKVWRRKVASRALRARRMGKDVPDELIRIEQTSSGPALIGQVNEKVKLLEATRDAMPGAGVDDLIAEGNSLRDAMQSADAQHETARLAALPDAVRRFYVQKGLLYVGLKVIHDAARELHAADHAAAARYNLGILHRHAAPRKPEPQPAPAGA